MITVWHFFVHWIGTDYGLPYGHFGPYDAFSGFLGLSIAGGLAEAARRISRRRHVARLTQAAQHHAEHLAQLAKQHKEQLALANKHHAALVDAVSEKVTHG